jgi:hypothetical protein
MTSSEYCAVALSCESSVSRNGGRPAQRTCAGSSARRAEASSKDVIRPATLPHERRYFSFDVLKIAGRSTEPRRHQISCPPNARPARLQATWLSRYRC